MHGQCVCLAAKPDGIKLKRFNFFCATKSEYKPYDEEMESRCVVKSSGQA